MKLPPVKLKLGFAEQARLIEIDVGKLTSPHFLINGLTGSGKSRLLTDLTLQLSELGCGATVVDPGGDLVEDYLAHTARKVIRRGNKNVFQRIHYFEPGNYATAFRMDPFHFDPAKPIHPELRPSAYRAWLACTVARIGELVQLKQGQVNFEQNARLQRVLTNLLTAVGMAVDDKGRHLPLSAALLLLQVGEPGSLHDQVYRRVEPFLDRDTRADFERLRGYRREEDRLKEVESTINRLRSILTPIAKSIFGATYAEETVRPRQILLERGVMLWNLRPTEYFSPDAKTTFGKLAIQTTLSTMMSMPRDLRVPHVLIIDEASEFADELLLWSLGAMRKAGQPFSIILAGQDLASFQKEGFDMRSKVLSQCNLVCFNQTWPEDTEILARVLFSGELDFTPLVQEVERDGGYDWVELTERSTSKQVQMSASAAQGKQESESHGTQAGVVNTDTKSRTATKSASAAAGETTLPGNVEGPKQKSHAAGNALAEAAGQSVANSAATTHGKTTGTTNTETVGAGLSVGESESHKKMPLHRVVREKQKTGTLEKSVPDQLEKGRSKIASQPKRHAFVKIHGEAAAHPIVTRDVPDPFESPEAQVRMVEWVKRELYALHAYYTVPSLDPAEEERRVREGFLAADEADEPQVVENRPDDLFED